MKHILSTLFVLTSILLCQAQTNLQLIPYPEKFELLEGDSFYLSSLTGIENKSTKENSNLLRDFLEQDFLLVLQERVGETMIHLIEDSTILGTVGSEGYTLTVDKNNIVITGANSTGVFYGIQTLRQIVDRQSMNVPSLRISDKPNYHWRAMMLDESRHLKGKRVVKDILDRMAILKMNILHWHLTDDQGWRLEIKKYPKLTEIAAFRDSSEIGGWHTNIFDGKPHGGYYTHDDIREIIDYAAVRHISIVPEIEMPGHATAVIAAYPEVGVLDHPVKVPAKFGVSSSVFNVSDPKTIEFINNILTEVFELFPSKVIHIGGDEIHLNEWKASKDITKYMKMNKIKSYNDLQVHFTNQVSNFIEKHGREMMGWNDILGKNLHEFSTDKESEIGTLSDNAIIHFWKGDVSMMIDAIHNGYRIVNSTHFDTYLDYSYDKLPLSKAYGFSPFPKDLDPKYREQVLGLGCQMWSEWVPSIPILYRQVFPRLAAYAEVGWTIDKNKDYERFLSALKFFQDQGYIPLTKYE